MPVLEGYSEGSLFLPVLQAQDAVLLKKCKLRAVLAAQKGMLRAVTATSALP